MNVVKLFQIRPPASTAGGGKVTKTDLQPFLHADCSQACLVFVDGLYRADLSCTEAIHPKLSITMLSGASPDSRPWGAKGLLRYRRDTKEHFRDTFGSDILSTLNMAHMQEASILSVPSGLDAGCLQVIQVVTEGSSFPRLIVKMGTNSSMRLLQCQLSVGKCSSKVFVGSVTQSHLANGSSLHHTYLEELAGQQPLSQPSPSPPILTLPLSLTPLSQAMCVMRR